MVELAQPPTHVTVQKDGQEGSVKQVRMYSIHSIYRVPYITHCILLYQLQERYHRTARHVKVPASTHSISVRALGVIIIDVGLHNILSLSPKSESFVSSDKLTDDLQ